MPTGDNAIIIEKVTKTFGEKVAVKDLDLAVPTGCVCGFLGPNGAGKTTTIRMVMSIFGPDSGAISVLGRRSAAESKDLIGYLPEERGVYRKMRVGAFLSYMATLKDVPSNEIDKRIDAWLERIELPGVKKKKCEELSKGMQQKVQFLAAVIHEPRLIILDEPFSGLDPVNARLLRNLISELHNDGRTIIFSTHVLASAEQVCDRIVMINRGEKVLDGPISRIRERFDPKTIVIEPVTPDDRATGAINGAPGVRSVSRMDDSGTRLEAHLSDGADPQAAIRSIVDAIPVRRIELRRATLEDIFVSLVDPGDSEDSIRAALQADAAAQAAQEAPAHA